MSDLNSVLLEGVIKEVRFTSSSSNPVSLRLESVHSFRDRQGYLRRTAIEVTVDLESYAPVEFPVLFCTQRIRVVGRLSNVSSLVSIIPEFIEAKPPLNEEERRSTRRRSLLCLSPIVPASSL